MERVKGIEPSSSAWKAEVLPLNYTRKEWWLRTESNRRHKDFQSFALPTELLSHNMAARTGPGTATPSGAGRESNQPD